MGLRHADQMVSSPSASLVTFASTGRMQVRHVVAAILVTVRESDLMYGSSPSVSAPAQTRAHAEALLMSAPLKPCAACSRDVLLLLSGALHIFWLTLCRKHPPDHA